MILCPQCHNELSEFNGIKLICKKCSFELQTTEDLIIFHPDQSGSHEGMDSMILDDLVIEEGNHFWMVARKKLIKSIFDRYVTPSDNIIEIGAGTGDIVRYLLENDYKNLSVGEIHLNGLEHAKKYGVRNRYQFDLTKAPFADHFDVIGMFDVLEHIDDDDLAINNLITNYLQLSIETCYNIATI